MDFEALIELKNVLDLIRTNLNSQEGTPFYSGYLRDYLSFQGVVLSAGQKYFKNPELTIIDFEQFFADEMEHMALR